MSDNNGINPDHFPHVDLSLSSSRPGYDGPRYVPIPSDRGDGSLNLGDTDTGRTVFPTSRISGAQPEEGFYSDNTQTRDLIAMVGNQVD